MGERDAFEAALAETPDDEGLRQVYADWLDDHDEVEHAAFQRAWTQAAKAEAWKWLAEFASGHFTGGYDDHPEREYTAEDMVQAGHDWMNDKAGWGITIQQGSQSVQDELYGKAAKVEWWRNWSLATGVFVPADVAAGGRVFRCSC